MRAFAPRYPKVKDEGWWVVLGNLAAGRVLALRRVSVAAQASIRLEVTMEQAQTLTAQPLVVYCISDSYMGLDVAVQVEPKGGMWPAPQGLQCAVVEAVVAGQEEDDEDVEGSLDLNTPTVEDRTPVPDLAEVVLSLPGEDDDFWDPA